MHRRNRNVVGVREGVVSFDTPSAASFVEERLVGVGAGGRDLEGQVVRQVRSGRPGLRGDAGKVLHSDGPEGRVWFGRKNFNP